MRLYTDRDRVTRHSLVGATRVTGKLAFRHCYLWWLQITILAVRLVAVGLRDDHHTGIKESCA